MDGGSCCPLRCEVVKFPGQTQEECLLWGEHDQGQQKKPRSVPVLSEIWLHLAGPSGSHRDEKGSKGVPVRRWEGRHFEGTLDQHSRQQIMFVHLVVTALPCFQSQGSSAPVTGICDIQVIEPGLNH